MSTARRNAAWGGWMVAAVANLLAAPGLLATPPGVVYYLRAGSTAQEGCFGSSMGSTCACALLPPEPLRGTFILSPSTPDPTVLNFTLDNVVFRAPTLGQAFDGSGTYQTSPLHPGSERIQLDLSINGEPVMQWFGGRRVSSQGVIIEQAASMQTSCFNIALMLRATPFVSDWNADGAVAVEDLFEFLNAWFAGDGDANEDGQTQADDIFVFLNAWFERV